MKLVLFLKAIETALDRIQEKANTLMATLQNFKDLLAGIDAETNRIAAKIDSLVAQLGAPGMTEADEAEALTGLSALSERLKVIGADPTEPIPPVVEP